MAYQSWSVVFGEQPSAAKWNILGTNDASFNDGTGIGTNAITTTKIANAQITASKLATGASVANVATDQPTTSTSYTDLATSGPAVTVTIGANLMALVIVSCDVNNNGQFNSYMGFAVSGASTVAATDDNCLKYGSWVANAAHEGSYAILKTGLTAGSNTFTAKYRTNGSTANFSKRYITVIPL